MPKQTEWTKLVKKTYDEGHRKNAAFSLKDAMKLASKTRKSMGRKQQGGKEVKCDKNEQTGELVELNNGADKSEGNPESKPTESTADKTDVNPESKSAEESTAVATAVATGGRRHKRTRRGGNYSKKRSSRSRSKRSTYW